MADVTVTESNVTVTVAAPGPQGLSGTSGGSLGDLSDTLLESLANKDLLFYESSSSKWKNAQIDTSYVSGLGTAAVKDTGTSQSSVIIGNDTRLSDPRTPTDHSADKVTTGIFGVDRIPALAASKITSGTLGVDRIPAISTDKLTSGTLPVGRGGTGLTSVSTLLNSNTTKSDVGLSVVENTALSTWAGSGDITTVGTISNGTWAGTAIEYPALGSKPVLGTAAALDVGTGNLNVVQLSGVGAMPAVSGSALTGLNAGNFTSGTLAVARGGTGLTALTTLLNSNTTKSDVGLSVVENTAVSSWAGTGNITTLGTVGTGTWNATAILDTKLDLRVDHGVTFDGQGSVIAASKSVLVPVERAGVITAASLVGDASGSITITVKRYTPSSGSLNSATSLGTIALSSAQHARDTTLSGWTTSLSAGDVLEFVTTATIATVTRVTCKLKVELA